MEIESEEQFYTNIQACKVIFKYITLVTSVIILVIVIVWFILTTADIQEFEVKDCQ